MKKNDHIQSTDESHVGHKVVVPGPDGSALTLARLDGISLIQVQCACGLEEVILAMTGHDCDGGFFIPLNRHRAHQVADWLKDMADDMKGPQHNV